MALQPFNDDLGSSFMSGGRNPKPRKKPKEPPVTYAELDEAHRRVVSIYGRQDGQGQESVG
jgi:hypothetical protein